MFITVNRPISCRHHIDVLACQNLLLLNVGNGGMIYSITLNNHHIPSFPTKQQKENSQVLLFVDLVPWSAKGALRCRCSREKHYHKPNAHQLREI